MARFAPTSALLFFALLFSGCATTAELEQGTIYSFEHEDRIWEIIGYTEADTGENAVNDLVSKENGSILFWYRDRNQDGFLNEIIKGDLSIDEANRVYLAGILKAVNDGKYRDRPYEKKFTWYSEGFSYQVVTLRINDEEVYNLFIVKDLQNRESYTVRDFGANGTLDDPLADEDIIARLQPHYNLVLQQGLKRGRLFEDNGFFAVK